MMSDPQSHSTGQEPDFWLLDGPETLAMIKQAEDLAALAAQWDDLPPDPYLTEANPFRFRRHAKAVFDADTDEVLILPPSDYLQATENNLLFGGVPRRFAPVEWTPAAERMLTSLIRASVAEVLQLAGRTVVNLHQVRIVGGPQIAGTPVPEGRHRDGFDFISIHLIGRDVDGGGETSLLSDDGRTVITTLSEPMDSVYVDDRRFSHDTTPITGAGRTVRRDVLLMSYERYGVDRH